MFASAWQGIKTASKVACGLNLLGFTVTFLTESHKVQDFIGCGTFGLASLATLYKSKNFGPVQKLMTSCVGVWSGRLSLFLLYRVIKLGEDKRLYMLFPQRNKGETWLNKPEKLRNIIGFWVIQTLWCIIQLSPLYMIQFDPKNPTDSNGKKTKTRYGKMSPVTLLGLGMFVTFFLWEAIADYQKFTFKNKPENAGKFISSGLYKYCQFPNYFGEIGVWSSLFVMALPLLKKNNYWTIISPLFTLFLLTKVSGIPHMERQWNKKYASMKEFQVWRQNTNKIIPWFPKSNIS